jgi:signal transduction histidine kinase
VQTTETPRPEHVKPRPAAHPTPDFQALFEGAPGWYLVLAPDLTIVAASEAYLRTTGAQRAAILGRRFDDVFPDTPADGRALGAPDLRASLDRVRRTLLPDTMAVQRHDVPRPESEGGGLDARHWRPTNVPVCDAAGVLTYIIHRLEDVTEAVRLSADLKERQARLARLTSELEHAVAQLESFSYSVSHDLRAPLRAIDGFSQALVEDYGATLPAEGQRLLTTVRESAQRMGRMIEHLVGFVRVGMKPLALDQVDLTALTHTVVREAQQANAPRHVAVTVAALPAVRADPALLRQVLTHLVGNAFKFTRQRPAAQVDIGSRNDGTDVVCYVRDNGAGFDMRYAGKLFGVFQRLHRADEFEGTGIGLALVQRIMHRHGGRVWADARVDEGATFFFTLPPAGPP